MQLFLHAFYLLILSLSLSPSLSIFIYLSIYLDIYIYIYIYIYKGDFGLVKNYRGITLTPKAANIYNYNAPRRNHIEPKIEKILRWNQNGFRRNWSTTLQILTVHRILESVCAKNLEATILFVDFFKAFDSIHRGKMEQILLAYGLPKEAVEAIMMLYKNTKEKSAPRIETQTTSTS